jgi:glycosyltransferase involved in cell wall biosynthesis
MNRGGLETFIMNVYRELDRNKIQFDFLVHTEENCAYDNEIRNLGGKIFSVPSRKQSLIKNYTALNNFFRNHTEYKIVHQHLSSLTYITPLIIASKYNIPVKIVHGHSTQQGGNLIHKYMHKLNQLFIDFYATDYFACSDLAAKFLYPSKIIKNNTYKIINNAINIDNFVFNKKQRDLKRKEFNIKNKFVIGHIGSFRYAKNHKFLIDIFNYINEENNDIVLMLVGDGSLKSDIEDKVKKLNLTNNVIFTGVRSDVSDLLQLMDVFVMPSHYEGLPVTVIEAQTAGLPCVLSKSITNEVEIIDNFNWCSLNDEISVWADKILKYQETNIKRNTRKEIIDAGFDIKNITINLMNFYINKHKNVQNN